MSIRISPSKKPKQLYNFVKIDLESGFQNESYQQILKYNDYENLLKLFAKQQSGPGNEYINLDHSILLFDFMLTLMEHDKIGAFVVYKIERRVILMIIMILRASLSRYWPCYLIIIEWR